MYRSRLMKEELGVGKSYVNVSSCGNIVVGDWVIAQYDEKSYSGVVDIVSLNDVQVSVMYRMFTGFWKWQEKAEIQYSSQ